MPQLAPAPTRNTGGDYVPETRWHLCHLYRMIAFRGSRRTPASPEQHPRNISDG